MWKERHYRLWVSPGGFLIAVTSAPQVATPLQQAKCELLAFPWTPDVLAMCNLLAASANDIADLKRSYDAQNKGNQTPFNALLMPEMATLQDASGALPLTALREERAEHLLGWGLVRWPAARLEEDALHALLLTPEPPTPGESCQAPEAPRLYT